MAKKLFVILLGALFIAAFSVQAMAETKFEFYGGYKVEGHFYGNQTLLDDDDAEVDQAYFDHDADFNVTAKPTEDITVYLKFEVADEDWGQNDDFEQHLHIERGYADINLGFGTFSMGEMTAGTDGLANLGHGPSGLYDLVPFDAGGGTDRFKFVYPAGAFKLIVAYDKLVEQDKEDDPDTDDADWDRYQITAVYKWDGGGVSGAVYYHDDASNTALADDYKLWEFDVALRHSFGAFDIDFELLYTSGETENTDVDLSGLGFYIDGVYNYGPGKVGLAYIWVEGDDADTADEIEGYLSNGGDYVGMWAANNGKYSRDNLDGANNHWMITLFWEHAVTEDLMLYAGYAFAGLNETAAGVDDSYGSELDLKLKYNIMKNLTYTANFGYFMPGDYFEDTYGESGNFVGFQHGLSISF